MKSATIREVARKAHLMMTPISNFAARLVTRALGITLARRVKHCQALFRPAITSLCRCVSMVTPSGNGKVRQVVRAECHLSGCSVLRSATYSPGPGIIGEFLDHLRLRENRCCSVNCRVDAIAQRIALGDADTRFMRLVFYRRKLHPGALRPLAGPPRCQTNTVLVR